MLFGPIPQRKLPPQDAAKTIFHLARWVRAADAHAKWAAEAKTCVDFLESRQIKDEIRAALQQRRQPAYIFNKIGRLVRLVIGFFANNRIDVQFLPSMDDIGSQEVSEIISQVWKTTAKLPDNAFTDIEVVLDGITTGRGWFDTRLDFANNDFGEIIWRSMDPFARYVDPDATDYDINKAGFLFDSRWVSLAEVATNYGPEAASMVGHLFRTDGYSSFPTGFDLMAAPDDIRPPTGFGGDEGAYLGQTSWQTVNSAWHEFIDPYRKNVRLLDTQYHVIENRDVFIDLETGERKVIPDEAEIMRLTDGQQTRQQFVDKVMFHAQRLGNPLVIRQRPVTRVGWSTFIGDIMVFDNFSPYDTYSGTGYFPYFRRGTTRGMVADLIDPQQEYNKRRNAEILGLTRLANGGWFLEDQSMDPEEEAKLKKYGSQAGVVVKHKKGTEPPKEIQVQQPNAGHERAADKANQELTEISGINESAMGELDKVQSGRAIEARQRQAVIAIQLYSTNWSRTMHLMGAKFLNLMQNFYTEERVFRIIGENGRISRVVINQAIVDPAGATLMDRLNDVTLGKYTVSVDETPMAKSFQTAQFEEALALLEKMGPQMMPLVIDIIVDMSSLPRKEEFKERLAQAGFGPQAASAAAGLPMQGPSTPLLGAPQGQSMAPSLDQANSPGGAVMPVQPTGPMMQ